MTPLAELDARAKRLLEPADLAEYETLKAEVLAEDGEAIAHDVLSEFLSSFDPDYT
jgi:hypothetical protein